MKEVIQKKCWVGSKNKKNIIFIHTDELINKYLIHFMVHRNNYNVRKTTVPFYNSN